jgi:hypothetical protein
MAIIKLNNRAVKDATAVGSTTQLGNLIFISKQTISSPTASVSFTSGINNTYKEYIFKLINIHCSADDDDFRFNFSIDGGSNYNVTKTSTIFYGMHREDGADQELAYEASSDIAQGTGYQRFCAGGLMSGDNDHSLSGTLHLFDPSNTTFVKHFMTTTNHNNKSDYSIRTMAAGYANTTSAINAVDFKVESNTIDAGTISLYGVV